MLIVKLKKGDNITKALKKFKQKVRNTKLIQEIRERKQFDKPSAKKRANKKKAIRVNQWRLKNED
jgi:small subunit ribosomal protein S21